MQCADDTCMPMQGADLRVEAAGAVAAAGGRAIALLRQQRPQRSMHPRIPGARNCMMPAAAFPLPLLTGRFAQSSPAPRCSLPRLRTPRRPPHAEADPLQPVSAHLDLRRDLALFPLLP